MVCREQLKNTVYINKLQSLASINTEEDYVKFLSFISLETQIYRLAALAKDLESDRNAKIMDLVNMEDSIQKMTETYCKIIQDKSMGCLQQSYEQISIQRQQMLHRRDLRELRNQNQQLKKKLKQMHLEIESLRLFKKDQESVLNLTSDPLKPKIRQVANGFLKKKHTEQNQQKIQSIQDLWKSNSRQKQGQSQWQKQFSSPSHKQALQLSMNYVSVLQENTKLKAQIKALNVHQNPDMSMDKLLDCLQHEDSGQQKNQNKQYAEQKYKTEMNSLKKTNEMLQEKVTELQAQIHRQLNLSGISLASSLSHSSSQVVLNQSVTSEAQIRMLEERFMQLQKLNTKYQTENTRLRKQRDFCKQQFKIINKSKDSQTKNLFIKNFQTFTNQQLIQKIQALQNQKNALQKKNYSLSKQAIKIIQFQTTLNNLKNQYVRIEQQNIKLLSAIKNKEQTICVLREQLQQKQTLLNNLQQQTAAIKRSNQAINKSKDLSMEMEEYLERQTTVLKKQIQTLHIEHENISRMCQKYAKELKQANKQIKALREKINQNKEK